MTQRILTGLSWSGLDRVFQQLEGSIGFMLTLHRVRDNVEHAFDPNGHLSVSPQFLASAIELLRERGIEIVSMDEAAARLRRGPKPDDKRFCTITFDDGYTDNLANAVPVLQAANVPYAIYIASGLVEGSAFLWWEALETLLRERDCITVPEIFGAAPVPLETVDQKFAACRRMLDWASLEHDEHDVQPFIRRLCTRYGMDVDAVHRGEIMRWDEIAAMSRAPLCTIGSHTVGHRALARLEANEVKDEIVGGIGALESVTGERPRHFAYPYGYPEAASTREFAIAAKLGLETAVTTRPGMLFADHADHMTALPRISVNGLYQSMRYFAPLTSGLPTRLKTKLRRLDVA
ncbi:polysaccharide deacetylase family protein [Rhizobiaceae bacterium]|nr:polysaccharide deacetylase family protein [Rhizobiaceae bacterium]